MPRAKEVYLGDKTFATVDITAKMMLNRNRTIPLVSRKKGRFEEYINDNLRSSLPSLNLGENDRKSHECNQNFRDFPQCQEHT